MTITLLDDLRVLFSEERPKISLIVTFGIYHLMYCQRSALRKCVLESWSAERKDTWDKLQGHCNAGRLRGSYESKVEGSTKMEAVVTPWATGQLEHLNNTAISWIAPSSRDHLNGLLKADSSGLEIGTTVVNYI